MESPVLAQQGGDLPVEEAGWLLGRLQERGALAPAWHAGLGRDLRFELWPPHLFSSPVVATGWQVPCPVAQRTNLQGRMESVERGQAGGWLGVWLCRKVSSRGSSWP